MILHNPIGRGLDPGSVSRELQPACTVMRIVQRSMRCPDANPKGALYPKLNIIIFRVQWTILIHLSNLVVLSTGFFFINFCYNELNDINIEYASHEEWDWRWIFFLN